MTTHVRAKPAERQETLTIPEVDGADRNAGRIRGSRDKNICERTVVSRFVQYQELARHV
jgi:hypothetical protein